MFLDITTSPEIIENQITPLEITLSETLVNNLEEILIPSSEGIIIYTNIYKWS